MRHFLLRGVTVIGIGLVVSLLTLNGSGADRPLGGYPGADPNPFLPTSTVSAGLMATNQEPIIVRCPSEPISDGQLSTISVILNGPAEIDQVVFIQTDHPEAFSNIPAYIVIPAGSTSQSFQVQAAPVSGSVAATINAGSYSGQAQAIVAVTPTPAQ